MVFAHQGGSGRAEARVGAMVSAGLDEREEARVEAETVLPLLQRVRAVVHAERVDTRPAERVGLRPLR